MKKASLFFILLSISTAVSPSNGAIFAGRLFDKHLGSRLEENSLIIEFEDWRIYRGKTIRNLFWQELEYSPELKKSYMYFRSTMNVAYGTGLDTKIINREQCSTFVRCNVDVIIDTFRKCLIKHGIEQENTVEFENVADGDIAIENTEKTQLDMNITFAQDSANHPVLAPETDVIVQERRKNEWVIEDTKDSLTIDGDDAAFPKREEIDISDEKIEERLRELGGDVDNEVTFHDKLVDAVNRVPKNLADNGEKFKRLALILMGIQDENAVKIHHLKALKRKLDGYLDSKILAEKPYEQYTWWEKQLHNSRYEWLRNKCKKKIASQRVSSQDRPWVIVALNIKDVVMSNLVQTFRVANKPHLMRKVYDERKKSLALSLLL